jgi:hypothetical protein
MSEPIYDYSSRELQALLNTNKDNLIAQINKDHQLKLDSAQYLVVFQERGCLGRTWDRVLGKETEGRSRIVILNVNNHKAEDHDCKN